MNKFLIICFVMTAVLSASSLRVASRKDSNNQLIGGWQNMNTLTFDAKNQDIVNEAVNAVVTEQNTTNSTLIFSKVVDVQEQIVAGVNYALTLEFINATSNATEFFKVIVYSAPWANQNQVVSVTPVEVSQKFSEEVSVGGWQSESPKQFVSNDGLVLTQAQSAIQNKFNPAAQGFEFQQVDEVLTQVVAGINYDVVLQYGNPNTDEVRLYDVLIYVPPNQSIGEVTAIHQVQLSA